MAGRMGAVQIAPTIRAAAMRGLKIVENSKQAKKYAGYSLSEIFADMIMEGQVKEVFDCVGKFVPKEMLVDVQGQISIDTTVFDPAVLREVFSGQGIDSGGDSGTPALLQGDTLEATERPTVGSISLTS